MQGKLHYMAPEQARGEPVGAAADVYALGATLDALLGGGTHGPVNTEESGNAREAAALLRGLSLPVCALIRSCLARDARFRPSAADVAARAGVIASQMLRDRRAQRAARLAGADPRAHGPDGRARRSDGPVPGPGAGGGDGARTFTISRVWQTPGSGRRAAPRRRPSTRASR